MRSYPNTTIVGGRRPVERHDLQLDGGTHNDPFNNLSLPLPFPDAMQEFKVETSALPAQYGHHSAAAVNAVTKSGTNVLRGGAFEFMRDDSLNATNAFAAIGADGKRRSDGLHRDQFGGTLGGPIVPGKLFYFGGYQGTRVNVTPTSFFQFVPTPAMLAGDFSTITSPACNAGRTIALRAPFVNNTVSPAQFSPAALNLAARLPKPINDCGQAFFDRKTESTEHIALGRDRLSVEQQPLDLRAATSWLSTTSEPDNDPDNVLAYANGPIDDTVHSFVLGDTYLLGSNTVNSFRVTYNSADIRKDYVPFFDYADLGDPEHRDPVARLHGHHGVGRVLAGSDRRKAEHRADQGLPAGRRPEPRPRRASDRARRQLHSFVLDSISVGAAAGSFAFTGVNTGLGLADFLLGRPTTLQPGTALHAARRR